MSTVADIVAVMEAEDSTSWAIADELAALDEIDPTTGKPLTLAQVSERIWETRGVEWSPAVLGVYRTTARAFPPDRRDHVISFNAHKVLRAHPDKLLKWKPKRDGDVLTVEQARRLRGGSASAAKPKPDAWRTKLKRAFGVIEQVAEQDPVFVIDMLEQVIINLERTYPKATKGRRGLRAV